MSDRMVRRLLEFYCQQFERCKVPAMEGAGKLAHAHWAAQRAREMPPDKADYWIGFVRGVLWCEGWYDLEELGGHIAMFRE